MKNITKLFLQGLTAILPIAITLYILFWLVKTAETALGGLIKLVITDKYYIHGMGVLAGIAVIFAVGILLKLWLFKVIFQWSQRIFEKIPLIKSLYGSISDLMSFFDTSHKKDFDQVVMIDLPSETGQMIGFLTRKDWSEMPDSIGGENIVSVYLPMSYQLGGFTVFVPENKVHPVEMSVEDAMRFALTAAMSVKKDDGKKNLFNDSDKQLETDKDKQI